MSTLLSLKDLSTHFFTDVGVVRAVDGVSFDIRKGETVGVVGESGCGKSVTAQSILRIEGNRGRIVKGSIDFFREGDPSQRVDIAQLDPNGRELRSIRGQEISIIFQEPMTSFCPVYTIGNQIMETILLHQKATALKAREQTIEMLRLVGVPKPEQRVDEYPHSLSGGLRQRAMIAMALSCRPQLLIADEPTTSLDVTVQAQILELMKSLQQEMGMAILLITHSLGVVAEMADTVVVMYLGRVVETASVEELFGNPKHPYTSALMRSIPRLGMGSDYQLESIKGTVPDPYNVPPGCPFAPRCPEFMPGTCDVQEPPLTEIVNDHTVRCFLYSGGGVVGAEPASD